MTQEEFEAAKAEFIKTVDLVRLEAYAKTGYEWMVVPRTGANRTIKAQHALYIQPFDGIDNDGDGRVDEADEKVTKADGGQSPHNFNLARDITPCKRSNEPWWAAPKSIWQTMADIAVEHGLTAGFYFKSIYDAPHIEAADWKLCRDAWRRGEIDVA